MYDQAPPSLAKEPQGSITHLDPGDVVSVNVYDGNSFQPDGHVLIVSATSGSKVTFVSQNFRIQQLENRHLDGIA